MTSLSVVLLQVVKFWYHCAVRQLTWNGTVPVTLLLCGTEKWIRKHLRLSEKNFIVHGTEFEEMPIEDFFKMFNLNYQRVQLSDDVEVFKVLKLDVPHCISFVYTHVLRPPMTKFVSLNATCSSLMSMYYTMYYFFCNIISGHCLEHTVIASMT